MGEMSQLQRVLRRRHGQQQHDHQQHERHRTREGRGSMREARCAFRGRVHRLCLHGAA
jgi:hypothetical protein